jgi:hypothetical protein
MKGRRKKPVSIGFPFDAVNHVILDSNSTSYLLLSSFHNRDV